MKGRESSADVSNFLQYLQSHKLVFIYLFCLDAHECDQLHRVCYMMSFNSIFNLKCMIYLSNGFSRYRKYTDLPIIGMVHTYLPLILYKFMFSISVALTKTYKIKKTL